MGDDALLAAGVAKQNKQKIMVNVTGDQYAWLRKQSYISKLSMSELTRRAIDAAMDADKVKTD